MIVAQMLENKLNSVLQKLSSTEARLSSIEEKLEKILVERKTDFLEEEYLPANKEESSEPRKLKSFEELSKSSKNQYEVALKWSIEHSKAFYFLLFFINDGEEIDKIVKSVKKNHDVDVTLSIVKNSVTVGRRVGYLEKTSGVLSVTRSYREAVELFKEGIYTPFKELCK